MPWLLRTLVSGLPLLALSACESVTTQVIPVARIDLSPPSVSVIEGESTTVTAVPKSASGHTLFGRQVQWSITPTEVAQVSGNGVVTGISAGQAILTATIESSSATGPVSVLPGPELELSRDRVDISAPEGENSPPVDVSITNGGNGTITGLSMSVKYDDGQPEGWLSAGLNGTRAPTSMTLQASALGLTRGVYRATVTVKSPVAGGLSAMLLVVFGVETPAPSIVLETDAVAFSALLNGQQPAVQTVDVTNGGGGTLEDLAVSVSYPPGEPTGWLQAFLSSTIAPATLTLRAYPTGLDAGTYPATVSVSSPDAANSPQEIAVAFTVTPPGGSSTGSSAAIPAGRPGLESLGAREGS